MTSATPDHSQQMAAKVAGVAYLMSFVIVVFAQYRIHNRLIVESDAVETARNILEHERLFRIGIVCGLIYCIGVVVLLTALYIILKPVHPGLALLAALSRLIYAMVWVQMTLNLSAALRLLQSTSYLQTFDSGKLYALARLSLGERFDQYYVGLLFCALASSLCSYLWFKSAYLPRALAIFGLIASVFCLVCTLAFMVYPGFYKIVHLWLFDTPMGIFDLATSFWLLFRGLRPNEGLIR
jgi:hypothetical protein